MPAPEIETPWYVSRNGQQFGPMSRSQVAQMYAQGNIVADDHLWSSEIGNWTLAADILGQSPAVPPPPPPMQPPAPQQAVPVAVQPSQTVTHTVVEGGSFKFGTFVWIVLGLIVPLWPITLPLCWYLAYRSYKKPSTQIVRVTKG